EVGRNQLLGMLPAEENEAVVDGCRVEMGSRGVAGMEADAVDGDGGTQCCLLSHALSNASRSIAVTVPVFVGRNARPYVFIPEKLTIRSAFTPRLHPYTEHDLCKI